STAALQTRPKNQSGGEAPPHSRPNCQTRIDIKRTAMRHGVESLDLIALESYAMPAPSTTDKFLDLVRKSGVVDQQRLDACLAGASGELPSSPVELAALLIRDGILTHFQAEQLLQGKWRRFSIGKYKVLERLGAGTQGSVYLCLHKLTPRRVAVKVLPAS